MFVACLEAFVFIVESAATGDEDGLTVIGLPTASGGEGNPNQFKIDGAISRLLIIPEIRVEPDESSPLSIPRPVTRIGHRLLLVFSKKLYEG